MAIGWGSSGTSTYSAAGGATVAPPYPAVVNAGDLCVLTVGQKPATAGGGGIATPSGWTPVVAALGGGYGGTLGDDVGDTRSAVFVRMAAGTEDGTTVTVDLSDNSVAWAKIVRYTRTDGDAWDVAGTGGEDTSGGNVSATMVSDPGIAAGDFLVGTIVVPTDVNSASNFSAWSISVPGATVGTVTEVGELASAKGTDVAGANYFASVSAGSSSGAATVTATGGGTTTNLRGPVCLIRLRAVTAVDAAVSATPIGGSSAFPAATVGAGGVVSATQVAGAVTFPAATVSVAADATATPAPVTGTATFPAPTVSAGTGAAATPTTLARAVVFPAATVAAGSGATAAPAPLATAVAFPARTTSAGATASPTTISRAVSFPAPTLAAGAAVSPAPAAGTIVFPAPTVSAGASESAHPTPVTGTTTFPAPTVGAGSGAEPAQIVGAVTFPAPTVTAGGSSTVSPAPIVGAATFPAVSAGAGATATPGALATGAVVFPAATIGAGAGPTPAPVTGAATFPAPTISAGATVYPTPATTGAAFPATLPGAGATAAPAPVDGAVTFPPAAVEATGASEATPAPIGGSVTFTTPTISAGGMSLATPAPVAGTATFPAVFVVATTGTTRPDILTAADLAYMRAVARDTDLHPLDEELTYMRAVADDHRPTTATWSARVRVPDGSGGTTWSTTTAAVVHVLIHGPVDEIPDDLAARWAGAVVHKVAADPTLELRAGDLLAVSTDEVYEIVSSRAPDRWTTQQVVLAARIREPAR